MPFALQDTAVPQRWFAHFYALGSVCNGACLACFLTHLSREAAVEPDQVRGVPLLAKCR